MKKRIFSLFAIVGLAMATTLSLSILTACDDDDDDDLTETVDTDDDADSSDDTDGDSSSDDTDSSSDDAVDSSSATAGTAVDLGLSVKWATVNIGATLPADYGNYYAWGETETKDEYTSDNSVTYGDSSFGDISGDATYDAATANWGSSWRMPTEAECQELIDDCTWTWTTQENSDGEEINGYLVKGTNGNSIFLPAAGRRYGSSLYYAGTDGYYWSSTPYASSSYLAYSLYFPSSLRYVSSCYYRYYGGSVRPVSE